MLILLRLALQSAPNDSVSHAIIYTAPVAENDREYREERGRVADQCPDGEKDKGPPLKDEYYDEDHHDFSGAVVAFRIRINQFRSLLDFDPDGSICHSYDSERQNLNAGYHFTVFLTSWRSQIDETPENHTKYHTQLS